MEYVGHSPIGSFSLFETPSEISYIYRVMDKNEASRL